MITLEHHAKPGSHKVLSNGEFIGWVTKRNENWLFNPDPDITLQSFTSTGFITLMMWIEDNFD